MTYYQLKSIIMATKSTYEFQGSSASFGVVASRYPGFIEPSFDMILACDERPQVILISAVGATGKTTLASQLSFETKLPLLDLSQHKPVADNTLTGLITNSFAVETISEILGSIGEGKYGIIIDGLDEGRSKTTEKAFEAFLDDLIKMSRKSVNTAFVLMGRVQAIEECWSYLVEQQMRVLLLAISPFKLTAAKKYINGVSGIGNMSPHRANYEKVRDLILDRLSTAFRDETNVSTDFMSFIGYPPVLDAIGTLLRDESNYFKLFEDLNREDFDRNEVKLLLDISERILLREREEKVVPNIIKPLFEDYSPEEEKRRILRDIFSPKEQCLRLLHRCSSSPLNLEVIKDTVINDKYEESLHHWLEEHPFVENDKIRNAVFEALVMSQVIDHWGDQYAEIVSEYASKRKGNYHLVYMFNQLSTEKRIPVACLGTFVDAAMEFNTRTSSVHFEIQGPSVEDLLDELGGQAQAGHTTTNIDIELEITFQGEGSREYSFSTVVVPSSTIQIRDRLQSTTITVPCNVFIRGATELHLIAPVDIHCASIQINAPHLLLTSAISKESADVLFECGSICSTLEKITPNGIPFTVVTDEKANLSHPIVRYAEQRQATTRSLDLSQRYLRLRRIIVEFRSHSRGRLARLKDKIHSDRVLKNTTGEAVLRKLIADGVLILEGSHYFIDPEKLSQKIGISWVNFRKGKTSEKLDEYLLTIR